MVDAELLEPPEDLDGLGRRLQRPATCCRARCVEPHERRQRQGDDGQARPPDRVARGTEGFQAPRQSLRGGDRRQPPVAQLGGPADRAPAVPTHVDRRWLLHRLDQGPERSEREELALEGDLLLAEELPDHAQVLVVHAPPRREVDPERLRLGGHVARTGAQDHAPAGEHVEGAQHLGLHEGVPVRHDHDVARQLHPRRERGEVAPRDVGLEPPVVAGVVLLHRGRARRARRTRAGPCP